MKKKLLILINYILLIVLLASSIWYLKTKFYSIDEIDKTKNREEIKVQSNLKYGGVVADDVIAANVGMEILKKGGNAVDAAIAVSYALGVTQPHASGLGGGGVMMIYSEEMNKPVVIDYLETAPSNGKVPSRYIGIPGFVKGMETAHKIYGKLDLKEILEPVVKLAEEGFTADERFVRTLTTYMDKLNRSSLPGFFPDGGVINVGEKVVQRDLANLLRQIQENGSKAFYEGDFAKNLANSVSNITIEDLKNYKAIVTEPVSTEINGYTFYSSPPPFGGITLIQMLNMFDALDVDYKNISKGELIEKIGYITRAAYYDRLQNVADPSFYNINIEKLTSKSYAKELINKYTNYGVNLEEDTLDGRDHTETTHIVVVDKNGMVVSVTNSLSDFFGSGFSINGVILNNHLSNFSQNISINKIQPNKKPRVTLSPTIVVKGKKPVLAIGSPGGKRIPMMVAQVLFKLINEDFNPEKLSEIINQPRYVYEDNKIYTEELLNSNDANILRKNGYLVIPYNSNYFYGNVNAIMISGKSIYGVGDTRRGAVFVSEKGSLSTGVGEENIN